MIKPPLDLFPQDLKVQIRVIVMFRVLAQLFLPITSQNLSKIQNFISEDYASLQWFQGQSPTVKDSTPQDFIIEWHWSAHIHQEEKIHLCHYANHFCKRGTLFRKRLKITTLQILNFMFCFYVAIKKLESIFVWQI